VNHRGSEEIARPQHNDREAQADQDGIDHTERDACQQISPKTRRVGWHVEESEDQGGEHQAPGPSQEQGEAAQQRAAKQELLEKAVAQVVLDEEEEQDHQAFLSTHQLQHHQNDQGNAEQEDHRLIAVPTAKTDLAPPRTQQQEESHREHKG